MTGSTGGGDGFQANINATPNRRDAMTRAASILVLAAGALALAGCPTYHEYAKLSEQEGLLPADQYARYGAEQAQAMAIAREYAHFHAGDTRTDLQAAADSTAAYARTLPDVVGVTADSLGHRMTIQFRSGWRTMVNPVDDGRRGAETVNLPGR
jgi:hypothetical protein